MSSRGGKRRQVLQLGSASKLHRYGYSKEFHSLNKKGKAGLVPSLVGECSDTDSEDIEDVEDQVVGDVHDEDDQMTSEHIFTSDDHTSAVVLPDKSDSSNLQENPADMDDALKSFLSEIEAIPMPTAFNGSEQVKVLDSDPHPVIPSEVVPDEPPKPIAKPAPSSSRYSMFVKGESEFVHSPQPVVEDSPAELKQEDFPEEPTTNWQMVQDEGTQYYYYWNTVTNEVTWEIPSEYTQFLLLHREYEEKIAKLSPEQLEKLKEKRCLMAAVKDSANKNSNVGTNSKHQVQPPTETRNISLSVSQSHDDKSHKVTHNSKPVSGPVREVSPSKSLSPHLEAGQDSRQHKHKKEKRSHHKKKHKRKHGDSNSDEDKQPTKSSDINQTVLHSEAAVASGYKFPSIVPYLSDQDDSDNDDSSQPLQGSVTVSVIQPKIKDSEAGPIQESEKTEPDVLTDSDIVITNDVAQLPLVSQTTETYTTSVLLPPPPPPPPEEDEPKEEQKQKDIQDIDKNIAHKADEACTDSSEDIFTNNLQTNSGKTDSINHNSATELFYKEINEIISASVELDAKTQSPDPVAETQVTDLVAETQTTHPVVRTDPTVHVTDSAVTTEVIGPIARPQFIGPVARPQVIDQVARTQNSDQVASINATDSLTKTPVVESTAKSNIADNESGSHILTKQDLSSSMNNDVKVSEKNKVVPKEVIDMFAEHFPMPVSVQKKDSTRLSKSSTNTNKHSAEVVTKIEPSEEVMEEGEILEVSEKEVGVQRDKHKASDRAQEKKSEKIKSETVETKPLFKSINIVGYASDDEEEEGEVRDKIVKKDEKSSQKHKRKDKKRESRKRRKDTISDSSSTLITNSRPEKKVVSTAIVTPVQKVASQEMSVVAAVVKPETNKDADDDDVDIDFDVDDIDRALEVALEKKLDKKKLTKSSNGEQEAKTDDKENRFQDESIHNLPSGEPAPKQITSSTAIFQAKNLDTNVSEPISDKDSTSHPIKKTINEIEKTVCEQDDEKILTEIKEMAELALNKLEFLDISTDSLSRLQVLFIELQTRHTDWTAGGLSTHYFYEQLKTAQGLLEQYELSAVPEGWACQWDRANNRYYYRNSATNRIQWEYPEVVTSEAVEEESVAVSNEKPTNKVSDRGSEEHRRSRGSGGSSSVRYRKRDEKEKNKRDKRSNSRHYHRKRRRGRDQSNSSNSSGESQQHRRHRKSKKKKRHRTERSPSVEILENTDGMDDVEIIGTPSNMPQPASPPVLPDIASDVPASSPHSVTVDSISEIDVTSNAYVSQPPVEDGTELNLEVEGEPLSNTDNTIMEEAAEVVNTAVITKPPQIVVPPQIAAALNPDDVPPGAAVADLYSTSQLITSAPGSFYSSYAVAPPTEQAIPSTDMHIGETNHETSMETDKSAKKKKKDKKSLTTGSSIMMKKKHMSSMVQKWQKVKIEVEKEDRAKELRQAAIRKKIEELKSSDNKQS